MNLRYIVHDQTFKKFLVGLVMLVGLTGLGIYSAKNILPDVNDKIAKTNDIKIDKTNSNEAPTKPPTDSLNESNDGTEPDSAKTNQSQGTESSNQQSEAEVLKNNNSLPVTGNKAVLSQAIALGLITFSFVHVLQIRNKF